MKKYIYTIIFFLSALLLLFATACNDRDVMDEPNYETIFRVFECNETYSENESASSRFVSEGALITIWEPTSVNDNPIPKVKLETNADGTSSYKHNNEVFFYTIEKKEENNLIKKNLTPITINHGESKSLKHVTFQIAGIFNSDEDIATHAQFNIDPSLTTYVPHVGAIKFKDINGDQLIDEKDIVSIASHSIWDGKEISVYINTLR